MSDNYETFVPLNNLIRLFSRISREESHDILLQLREKAIMVYTSNSHGQDKKSLSRKPSVAHYPDVLCAIVSYPDKL